MKSKTLLFILLPSLIVHQTAVAEIDFTIAADALNVHLESADPACIRDSSDIGDIGSIKAQGLGKGECLESNVARSPLPLPNLVARKLSDRDKYIYVMNIKYKDDFWIARIPKNVRVTNVVFQKRLYWPLPQIAHLQSYFDLAPDTPVELFRQNQDLAESTSVHRINRLYLSVEALQPQGEPEVLALLLVLPPASLGLYTQVFRWEGEGTSVSERFINSEETLEISDELKRVLFLGAITESAHRGLRNSFNLFIQNCSIGQFDLIDSAVEKWLVAADADPELKQIEPKLRRNKGNDRGAYPGFLGLYLRSRGIQSRTTYVAPTTPGKDPANDI